MALFLAATYLAVQRMPIPTATEHEQHSREFGGRHAAAAVAAAAAAGVATTSESVHRQHHHPHAAGLLSVHYCIIHPLDLSTPHARCFNSSSSSSSKYGRSRSSREATSSSSNNPARYPCLPLELHFDSMGSMHSELGVSNEAERLATVLVVRGDGDGRDDAATAASASASAPSPGDDARLAAFARQYERTMAPKLIFPKDSDPNEPFRSQFVEKMKADPQGAPAYRTSAPPIAQEDLLLFHDRLSWTLFVQSVSGPDGDRRFASVAARCPLRTAPFGEEHALGRKPHKFEQPVTTRASCLPHHELLFGRMERTAARGEVESHTEARVAHNSYSCDGHASPRALLVPRALFYSSISELACRPTVHSMLDLFLELQDDNEHRSMELHQSGTRSPTATPASASSPLWNTLGPDGRTVYRNSNKSFWLINSRKQFVDPSIYLSEKKANEGDEHEGYPNLEGDEGEDAAAEHQHLEPIRVVCTSLLPGIVLPARPPLHPRSPAFHHLHRSFPPSPEYLAAVAQAQGAAGIGQSSPSSENPSAGSKGGAGIVQLPNPQDLKTFLQPQRKISLASWSTSRFAGWVDVQGQGKFICPGCVLRWDYCRWVAGKVMGGETEAQHAYWADLEYFSCALAGDANDWEHTVRGCYLEKDGFIARVTPTPYTSLESPVAALRRRRIRRVVYSDLHVSWHGCVPSSPMCCNGNHPEYPLSCRNIRRDNLWIQNAPCCLKHVIALYHYVVTLFEQHHVEWALGFGTLLSALRSQGGMNPYDYDIDLLVYMHGYRQIKALIPQMEAAGYAVIYNYDKDCVHDCYLYRIVHQAPDHLHQSTLDIFLQDEVDRPKHPFNLSMTFLARQARVPFDAEKYLDERYPGWKGTQVMSVENWSPNQTGKHRGGGGKRRGKEQSRGGEVN